MISIHGEGRSHKYYFNQSIIGKYLPEIVLISFRVLIHRLTDKVKILRDPKFQEDHYTRLIYKVIVEEITILEVLEEMNE